MDRELFAKKKRFVYTGLFFISDGFGKILSSKRREGQFKFVQVS